MSAHTRANTKIVAANLMNDMRREEEDCIKGEKRAQKSGQMEFESRRDDGG